MKTYWSYFFLLSILVLGCGERKRDLENYGNLGTTPGGIVIIDANEHQGGFGRSQCLLCHNTDLNVHRGANSVIDAESLNVLISKNGLNAYCLSCHGNNGQ